MTIGFWSGGISGNTRSFLYATGTQTARGTAGTLVSYTIPAGTLETDGDYIQADWMFTITGGAPDISVRMTADGSQIAGGTYSQDNSEFRILAQIIRSGTDTYSTSTTLLQYQSPITIVTTNGTGTIAGTWGATAIQILGEANIVNSGTITSNLFTVGLYTS